MAGKIKITKKNSALWVIGKKNKVWIIPKINSWRKFPVWKFVSAISRFAKKTLKKISSDKEVLKMAAIKIVIQFLISFNFSTSLIFPFLIFIYFRDFLQLA